MNRCDSNTIGAGRLSLPASILVLSICAFSACSSGDGPPAPPVPDTGLDVTDGSALADGNTTDTPGDTPSDGPADVGPDDPDADPGDSADLGPDAADGVPDTDSPIFNPCGGLDPLTYRDEAAAPGEACGALGEGFLACNGPNGLRCVGESRNNACGGVGELRAQPGEACGCNGVVACDSATSVTCLGNSGANACGGCEALTERPGAVCDLEGTAGLIVCQDVDSAVCMADAANACGGANALTVDGETVEGAAPGADCNTSTCGAGVLVCNGTDTLTCQPTLPCNACGGSAALAGAPGTACGPCAAGVWTCDGTEATTCAGDEASTALNACGGCEPLASTPGDSCEVNGATGRQLCTGDTLTCIPSSNPDAGGTTNACGGTSTLEDEPGQPCGACGAGEWLCADTDRLACSVPDDEQTNLCGGCADLTGAPEQACGTCASGRLVCDSGNESLVCDGDDGDAARNACGGCGTLPGSPDEECGECAAWACQGTRLLCLPTPGAPGCAIFITCAELTCGDESRRCIESDGVADAECGDCLDGFLDDAGTCRPVLDCDSLACADDFRACTEAGPRNDAACGDCIDGYAAAAGVCEPIVGCDELACGDQGRVCTVDADGAACGACLTGFIDDAGTCRPRVSCDVLLCADTFRACVDPGVDVDASCGACLAGFVDDAGTCRPRQTCGSLGCDAAFRACVDSDETADASCGACLAGRVDDGGVCRPRVTCDVLDCGSQNRDCAANTDGSDDRCDSCVPGFVDAGGVCVPRDCGTLAPPANGAVNAGSTLFGSEASVTCDAGYTLVGSATRTCGADGQWSGTPAACNPVDCGALAAPTNGSISAGPTTLGSERSFACDTGYSLFGSSSSTCGTDGQWSNPTPTCQQSDCGSLAAPTNGSVSLSGTRVGDTATYACNTGYTLTGSASSTCEAGGAWSGTPPTCTPVSCGTAPAAAANSSFTSTSGTTFGATAQYACATGYTLSGTTSGAATYTRTCGATGTWGAASGTCQPVTCPTLTNPTNGTVGAGASTFGTTRTYACNTGYTLSGTDSRTCQANGAWSGNAPTCAPVDCGTLSAPTNGSVFTPGGTTYTQTATYTCATNFTLVGDAQRTCQSGGTWSGSAPTCAAITCPVLTAPTNGGITVSAQTVGGTATYRCNTGYTVQGNTQRVCQGSGTWSGAAATCAIVDCGPPPAPANGSIAFTATTYTATATPTCNAGFGLSGVSDVTCQADGSWTDFNGDGDYACEPVDCGPLAAPENGSVSTPDGTTFGAQADYACNGGYDRTGPANRTCQSNGTWSDAPPTCVLRTCGAAPAATANSSLISSDGLAAAYSCNEGYTLNGQPSGGTTYARLCDTNGTPPFFSPFWRPATGSCQAVACPSLTAPANGSVTPSSGTFGQTSVYACNAGLVLLGDSDRTCQADGTWTGTAPTCATPLALGAPCTQSAECGEGAWCPTNTTPDLRRCSPRALDGEPHAMDFVLIPRGTFLQGTDGATNEERPYLSTLSRNYWMSRTEVTQAQWVAATGGTNPSCFQTTTGTACASTNANPDGPVEQVDWFSSLAYANWLSAEEGLELCYAFTGCSTGTWWHDGGQNGCTGATLTSLDCTGYRLLTEAEWERAARAGTTTTFHWGDETTSSIVEQYAWRQNNSGSRSQPVGTRLPNPWGLFDVVGNVQEWVWDRVHTGSAYQSYPADSATDYLGAASGSQRGNRGGGSLTGGTANLRHAFRGFASEGASRTSRLGIRLARTAPSLPGVECPLLDPPAGGRVIVPSTFVGATATYSCGATGTLDGAATRTCGADGNWSDTAPNCVFPGCGTPPAVANGSFSTTGTETDDVATYSCNYGYDQTPWIGGPVLTCRNDGTWFNATVGTSSPPTCTPLTCPDPVAAIDGSVSFTSNDHDAVAVHECDAGWQLVGDETQVCDGELARWLDDPPVCLRDCGTLTAPANGTIDLAGTLEGDTASFTCSPGFRLSGSTLRTCTSAGNWSGTATTCQLVDCGDPGTPASGTRNLTGTGLDDTVEWSCDPGLTLIGSATATCTVDDEWTSTPPRCARPAGALCTADSQCEDGFWCPQTPAGLPAAQRRCSPVIELPDSSPLNTVYVPEGSYLRGSPNTEVGRNANETRHEVVLSRPIWMMETPVTQSVYAAINTDEAPSFFEGLAACDANPTRPGLCPVERVNFYDAMVTANALSALHGLEECYGIDESSCSGTPHAGCGPGVATCSAGNFVCTKWVDRGLDCDGWRLPTEAEWEYAARAGTTTATWLGNLSGNALAQSVCPPSITPSQTNLDSIALWCRNAGGAVGVAGARPPNPWGLRDILGHVYEWTRDSLATYPTDPIIDPRAGGATVDRVVRGGSWSSASGLLRAAARTTLPQATRSSNLGLRFVRTVPAAEGVQCPTLSAPANGSLDTSEGVLRGAVATLTCDPGYAVSGSAERACMHSGTWSGTAPSCVLQNRALGESCEINLQCPANAWCVNTSNPALRFCAPQTTIGATTLNFRYVPNGTFTMGSPVAELGRVGDGSEDQVSASVSQFFLAETEINQTQWRALMGNANPTSGTTSSFPDAPVTNVSWWSAVEFANRLSVAQGLTACYDLSSLSCTGNANLGTLNCGTGMPPVTPVSGLVRDCTGYRLPTEAEWEYAARAGTTTATWAGNLAATGCSGSATLLDPIAWHCNNSFNPTFGTRHGRPVGTLAANPWGLFDMLGNINEHVWDVYVTALPGGTNPATGGTGNRSARGGSFNSNAESVRAASRLSVPPSTAISTLGFRVARSAP